LSYLQNNEYIAYQAEGEYIIWVKNAHRFLRMKEPAYQVFIEWTKGTDQVTCTNTCISAYALGKEEARKFVSDLYYEFSSISKNTNDLIDSFPIVCNQNIPENIGNDYPHEEGNDYSTFIQEPFSDFLRSFYCLISNIHIRFIFGDVYLEEYFKPQFKQFECTSDHFFWQEGYQSEKRIGTEEESYLTFTTFHLFRINGRYFLKIDQGNPLSFPEEDYEHFFGSVYAEIINLLYDKKLEDWMAVLHAAGAVLHFKSNKKLISTIKEESQASIHMQAKTEGDFQVLTEEVQMKSVALIFIGPPGAGKSTIAALLLASGFRILSDDFLPVALTYNKCDSDDNNPISENNKPISYEIPMVFPVPVGICIKDNAIPYLSHWFDEKVYKSLFSGELINKEIFLPLPEHSLDFSPVQAQAILFIKYDPAVGFLLNRESNLEMMNDFLKQSWIANNAEAAHAFLQWYFSLPIYSLVYSNAEQMINGMKNLF